MYLFSSPLWYSANSVNCTTLDLVSDSCMAGSMSDKLPLADPRQDLKTKWMNGRGERMNEPSREPAPVSQHMLISKVFPNTGGAHSKTKYG